MCTIDLIIGFLSKTRSCQIGKGCVRCHYWILVYCVQLGWRCLHMGLNDFGLWPQSAKSRPPNAAWSAFVRLDGRRWRQGHASFCWKLCYGSKNRAWPFIYLGIKQAWRPRARPWKSPIFPIPSRLLHIKLLDMFLSVLRLGIFTRATKNSVIWTGSFVIPNALKMVSILKRLLLNIW